MADMSGLFERNRHARKHMNRTVLLDVTAIFNHNFAPVSPDRRPGTDIYIFPNFHISGNSSLRVDEGSFVDDGFVGVKFVDQGDWLIN